MNVSELAVARIRLLNLFVALVVATVAFGSARAGDLDEAVLLVATPKLGGGYSHTVLIAKPLSQDRHVGLILNRPMPVSLGTVFPEHEPSTKVTDPLHLGGPVAVETVFALVRTRENPGEGSLQLGPDLFLATSGPVIDGIIEQRPDRARFYTGLVFWEPGELAAEIASGLWTVKAVGTDVVFKKKSDRLWEDLARPSQGVTAGLRAGGMS